MPASGNNPPRRRGPPQDTGPSIEEAMRESETRQLDFPAAERATYVRAMVARLLELKREGRSTEDIKTQMPEFARDYPYLFEMVSGTGPAGQQFDPSNLQTMLAMLERMGAGSLTHHEATKIVGQRLAAKYIRPQGGSGGAGGPREGSSS